MEPNPSQVRIAMRAKYYNEQCQIQNAAMKLGLDLIPSYADKKTLNVVDYGCAQGSNSIEPLKKVISSLPENSSISMVFEDTPYNDFSTLAKTVNGHFSIAERGIFTTLNMVPVGYYQQVVPDGYADVGFSWSSLNYLEKVPSVSIDATASPAEFAKARSAAFAGAARADLAKLLHLRSREIREGGYLIAALGGSKPPTEETASSTGFQPFQAAMVKMLMTGKLQAEELQQMAMFPVHDYNIDEVRAALKDPKVAPLWEVDTLEPKLVEHPAWAIYQAAIQASPDNKDTAVREYAQQVLGNMLSASGWFWEDVLKKSRGQDWEDGDQFLKEVLSLAINECVEKFPDLKVAIWYNYIKLKRTGAKPE